MTPQIEELANVPPPSADISGASVLVVGTDAFVAYETSSSDDEFIALVHFRHCLRVMTGGPNDEAFGNHRFYQFGLRPYTVQRLVGSPWIEEVQKERHKFRTPTPNLSLHHIVFALKGAAVDVLATNVEFVGLFPTHRAAMEAAVSSSEH